MTFQYDEILKTLTILYQHGDVVELRSPKAGKNGTVSGYFNDLKKLAADAERWDSVPDINSIYITINPVNPALLSRAANRTLTRAQNTTSDMDIVEQRWLLIDVDAIRPAGISATDEEHETSIRKTCEIRDWLTSIGWSLPIEADSGNGGHLLYRIEIVERAAEKIKKVLEYLDTKFSDASAAVDTTVFNSARIWKLYGTTARKGDNTSDRPHRKAKMLFVPDKLECVTKSQLEYVISLLPPPEESPRKENLSHLQKQGKFDIVSWMDKYKVQYRTPVNDGHGTRYNLEQCPFNDDHRDASITQMESGAIAFNCFHNSCSNKNWQDVRLLFEPAAYDYTPKKAYTRSDWGNARRLIDLCGDKIRYCVEAKKWAVWDGTVWNWDDGEIQMQQFAKNTIQKMYSELTTIDDQERKKELFSYILKCEHQSKLKCMIDSANNEPGIPIRIKDFDLDKDLINMKNGILDLRTGDLIPHEPEKYFTKKISYSYNLTAQCPQWIKFLNDIFENDQEIIEFIQVFFGYCLTGHTKEQVFCIFHGHGSNGKGTFVDTIQTVMEEYYRTTDPSTIIQKKYERSSTNDLAELKGARLVTTSENDPHQILDEGRIKRITGQDPIKCRFLYQEFFEYIPEYSLVLLTNHEPIIKGQDYSIWRRVLKIPFNVIFTDQTKDNNLRERLASEREGIFKWLVDGSKKWFEFGLVIPEKIKTATTEYKETLDIVGDFITDCCDITANESVVASDLYHLYTVWVKINRYKEMSNVWFSRSLTERGFKRGKNSTGLRTIFGLNINKELWQNIEHCKEIEDEKTQTRTVLTVLRHFMESKKNLPYTSELYNKHPYTVPDNGNTVNSKIYCQLQNPPQNDTLDQVTVSKYLNGIREEWYLQSRPNNPSTVILDFMNELSRRLLNNNFTPPNSQATMKYVNDAFKAWKWM